MKRSATGRCVGTLVAALLLPALVPAADIAVPANGNLQAAIDQARAGDTITLAAGATYRGTFVLRNKGLLSEFITIRSSGHAGFVAGKRVTPQQAGVMPKLIGPGLAQPALATERGANHYRLVGLEMAPAAGDYAFDIVRLGEGTEPAEADVPADLELEHLYVHGDPVAGSKRGIAVNGKRITLRDSYISGITSRFQDSQAVCGWNGPGPITIVNNYLEAAGENIMFGGATPGILNNIPSDIVVRGNTLLKPAQWRKSDFVIKNLLELKNARRVLIEGNILDGSWSGSQYGDAILLTPRTEGGAAPWAGVDAITIRYNLIRNATRGMTIAGEDDVSRQGFGSNITVRDNLLDVSLWGFVMLGPSGVVIDHNTILAKDAIAVMDGSPMTGFRFTNNLALFGRYGLFGSGVGGGISALTRYAPGYEFTSNGLIGGQAASSVYPAGNYFPELAGVGFLNEAAGNYRLQPTSPFVGLGTDGRDLGADMATMLVRTGLQAPGEISGQASVTATPATVSPGEMITVTWEGANPATRDWVALYPVGGAYTTYRMGAMVTASSGVIQFEAPAQGGQYEIRLMTQDSFNVIATSAPFTVRQP